MGSFWPCASGGGYGVGVGGDNDDATMEIVPLEVLVGVAMVLCLDLVEVTILTHIDTENVLTSPGRLEYTLIL